MSADTQGLVSVIVPVFNRPAMLREAVASVVAQSWRPLELIIVDDGSTDETPETIRSLTGEHPDLVRSRRIDNAGPGAAREAGRQMAQGEFIQYLDSDDLLYPDKLARQVAALRDHPDCDVAYGPTAYRVGGELQTEFPDKRCGERLETLFPALLISRWWCTITPLYRASIDVAWSSLKQEEDWEHDARVAAQGCRLAFVDQLLGEFRHHDQVRSSRGVETHLLRLSERSKARQSIYQSAIQAGVSRNASEMQHFGRSAFLLGRQCAEAGLTDEARTMTALAGEILTGFRHLQPVIFKSAASLIGWQRMGTLANWLDRWRQ